MNQQQTLREDNVTVSDGRFVVPKPIRSALGIGRGDDVQFALVVDGGYREHFVRTVGTNYRVNIPADLIDEYAIEETADIEVTA